MKICRSVDGNGATSDRIELEADEAEALDKAHEIAAKRCAAAGVYYGPTERSSMEWCFYGALRIGGIKELMRYVTESNIRTGKEA